MIDEQQWVPIVGHRRSPSNKEAITARAYVKANSTFVRLSIGVVIAQLVEIKKGDRVNLFASKTNRSLLMIRKSPHLNDGYKLSHSGTNGSFYTFDFIYQFYNDLRLTQTILIDYDIRDDKSVAVDITKLRWKK